MKCGSAFNSKGEWQAANGKKRLKESGDAPEKKNATRPLFPPEQELFGSGVLLDVSAPEDSLTARFF